MTSMRIARSRESFQQRPSLSQLAMCEMRGLCVCEGTSTHTLKTEFKGKV